jgi:hypothetical protein
MFAQAIIKDATKVHGAGDLLERLMVAFKYISAELDPFVAQGRIIQECCTLLQCDRASLFLLDHKTGELLLQGGAHAMPRGCVPS